MDRPATVTQYTGARLPSLFALWCGVAKTSPKLRNSSVSQCKCCWAQANDISLWLTPTSIYTWWAVAPIPHRVLLQFNANLIQFLHGRDHYFTHCLGCLSVVRTATYKGCKIGLWTLCCSSLNQCPHLPWSYMSAIWYEMIWYDVIAWHNMEWHV